MFLKYIHNSMFALPFMLKYTLNTVFIEDDLLQHNRVVLNAMLYHMLTPAVLRHTP